MTTLDRETFFSPGLNRGQEATSGPVLLLSAFVVLDVKERYVF